jgi:hypothetical protein
VTGRTLLNRHRKILDLRLFFVKDVPISYFGECDGGLLGRRSAGAGPVG